VWASQWFAAKFAAIREQHGFLEISPKPRPMSRILPSISAVSPRLRSQSR
jgi:hypothetical protein